MYTKVYRHGKAETVLPLRTYVLKYRSGNASLRKSLRSVFRPGPARAAGVYHSNAVMGF
nr:MAG TPA: hypothetical protein [Microviridae sp.]